MKTYFYFSVNDKTKEPINKIQSNSELEAVETFASMKKLTVDEFTHLFNVKVYEKVSNKTPI
jgi:hypothetical protein